MEAGERRSRIEIQRDMGSVRDNYGQTITDWQTIKSRWAKIEPISGDEVWRAAQSQPQVTHRITVQYQELGLNPKDRIKKGERIFNIIAVVLLNDVNYLYECRCKEVIKGPAV